ncbi:MAG: preprotein translocase subunit YajC [Clostridia bacterium]|nr:preprotein translocase subunit YajC [Clostridia bacterium]
MFFNSLLTAQGGGGSIWVTLGMIAVIIVVFYFFGMRPQKKQERAAQDIRNNLSVGDEITTIGGIIGKVVSIKEETMVIETTRDHTRIRLLKSAVRSVDVPANVKIVTPEQTAPVEAKAPVKEDKKAKSEAVENKEKKD